MQTGEEVQETNDENQQPPKSNFLKSVTYTQYNHHAATFVTVLAYIIMYVVISSYFHLLQLIWRQIFRSWKPQLLRQLIMAPLSLCFVFVGIIEWISLVKKFWIQWYIVVTSVWNQFSSMEEWYVFCNNIKISIF